MGLRSLESGAAPPLGARLGTDTPAWDEPAHGELRDWDMLRGFVVGGLGVTWRHVPRVAMAALLLAMLLASVPTVLLCGTPSSMPRLSFPPIVASSIVPRSEIE